MSWPPGHNTQTYGVAPQPQPTTSSQPRPVLLSLFLSPTFLPILFFKIHKCNVYHHNPGNMGLGPVFIVLGVFALLILYFLPCPRLLLSPLCSPFLSLSPLNFLLLLTIIPMVRVIGKSHAIRACCNLESFILLSFLFGPFTLFFASLFFSTFFILL